MWYDIVPKYWSSWVGLWGHGVSGGDVAGPITVLASLGACAFVMGLLVNFKFQ